jgi:hypothetical protein
MTDRPVEPDLVRWDRTNNILGEIFEETERQYEKWGQQDHPVVSKDDPTGIYLLGRTYAFLELAAKQRAAQGERSWALIHLEEVFEALAAPDRERQRAEWVQVAAVAATVIAAMDRGAGDAPDDHLVTGDVPSRYDDLRLPGDPVIPFSRLTPEHSDTEITCMRLAVGAHLSLRVEDDDLPTEAQIRAAECVINDPAATPDEVAAADHLLRTAEETGMQHDWHHPAPGSGPVCRRCDLAHKCWSGEGCPGEDRDTVRLAGGTGS